MTVHEIQQHLKEMYGTEVSPTLISSVTDAVAEEIKAWQGLPLLALYPIVYLNCIHVKGRDAGACASRQCIWPLGINLASEEGMLGFGLPRLKVRNSG